MLLRLIHCIELPVESVPKTQWIRLKRKPKMQGISITYAPIWCRLLLISLRNFVTKLWKRSPYNFSRKCEGPLRR
jgi:hypothetical protein